MAVYTKLLQSVLEPRMNARKDFLPGIYNTASAKAYLLAAFMCFVAQTGQSNDEYIHN
jgi:hypothetical protein